MRTTDTKLSSELASFAEIWRGGYYEGDPLAPLARSTYRQINYMSVLHATYLRCIKPYVTPETVALEIGPGRGAWTRCMLEAREVWALDALSAEHNGFYEFLGHPSHVKYFQVEDFSCGMLPDDHFNYMFSFGALCHVSFDGITQYATNLLPKLKSGAECFWMVADYAKFNAAVTELKSTSIWMNAAPSAKKFALIRQLFRAFSRLDNPQRPLSPDMDDVPRPGRFYNSGTERTCAMLESIGYEVKDKDVGTILRDPMIYFRKP